MKFKFTIAIAILFFNLQSCTSNRSKDPNVVLREMSKSPDAQIGSENLHFDLPEGWFRIDTTLQGNKVTFLIKDNDKFQPIINVTNGLMRNMGHDEFVKGTKGELLNNMSGIQLVNDNASFDINGKECIWFTYNRTQNGVSREMIFYSIANNGISCNITAGVNKGGLKKYKPTIDSIVKSFRVGS